MEARRVEGEVEAAVIKQQNSIARIEAIAIEKRTQVMVNRLIDIMPDYARATNRRLM